MSSHKFDRHAWTRMDIFNQMGNIGSEVGRALAAKRRNDNASMEAAFWRGLDLIDATAESWSDKPTRLTELLRARELFASSVLTDTVDQTLEDYFMQFAVAARMRQFK